MSLFKSLYPLAQKTTLTLLVTAEGDQLRVNVTPRANDDTKGEKTLYPLSILATPDELDRDFAEAVAIYEPSTLSVLDQARAASAANGKGDAPRALPSPTTPSRGKPGRRPKAEQSAAPETTAGDDAGAEQPAEVDPRQTSIPGIDADTQNASPAQAPLAAEAGAQPANAAAAAPAADTTAADGGVDIF
jgi:PRTRC genetic system protein E